MVGNVWIDLNGDASDVIRYGVQTLDDAQKLTDSYIKRIEEVLSQKEKEVMEV